MGRLSEISEDNATFPLDEGEEEGVESSSYVDKLPEEIWIQSFESLAIQQERHFHRYVYRTLPGETDQQALCALSLTCKYFRPLAQTVLFRYPFPVNPSESLGNIRNDVRASSWSSQVCDVVLSQNTSLAPSIRSIALDVGLHIDYAEILDRTPNLTHLILFCSRLPIQVSARPFNIPTKLRDIEVQAYPYGDTLHQIATAYIPRDYTGHLVLSYGPLYGGHDGSPSPYWPDLSSLSLNYPDIRPGGLSWLLGNNNSNTGLAAFACEHANLDGMHQMEPIWKYHSSSLRELALTCPITSGTLPIERFTNLRRLVISGWFLANELNTPNCDNSSWPNRNIASRLPTSLQQISIQKPHLDIFSILLSTILPNLSSLKSLDLDLASFRSTFKNFGILNRDDYPVTKLGRKWREILAEAGRVDEACKRRGIGMVEGGFRKGLVDEARLRRSAKRSAG